MLFTRHLPRLFVAGLLALMLVPTQAAAECVGGAARVSFIQFNSPNIATQPATLLTIKGKLSVPTRSPTERSCPAPAGGLPAVLILHGSSGVDSRGDFYEAALNAAGFVTLQIDMWEARGVTGISNRPQLPVFTFADAFSALGYLAAQPNVDPARIGVIGFSWGGVVSLASSEALYAAQFGQFSGGRKFAAHVANYPVCYGANNPTIVAPLTPAQAGTQYLNLTGAPVLIQIGSKDSYDNGTARCLALAQAVNPGNNNSVEVATYENAYHAWDRIMIPVTALDPFANEGSYFSSGVLPTVIIVPDLTQAGVARARAVAFFRQHL
jgi:uncharacterized protein